MAREDSSAKDRSFAETVQDSRKGDRFHHVWAAVRSLKLLDIRSGLRSIWIEGAGGREVAGDEVIDVVEYYGADDEVTTKVIVRQLKYSTRRASLNFGLADAKSTLQKFALVDQRAYDAFSVPPGTDVKFSLVTNRPIGRNLKEALRRIADGKPARPGSTHQKLVDILGPSRESAASFARRIFLDSDTSGLQSLRAQLDVLTASLTGASDPGIPAMLVEAVGARERRDQRRHATR